MARLFTSRGFGIAVATAAILLSSFFAFWLVSTSESSNFSISRYLTIPNSQPVTTLNISKKQDRNTSNITRDQYNAALAKWNSLDVTDYEAIVQDSTSGRWKATVHVDNTNGGSFAPGVPESFSHKVVKFESLDSKAAKMVTDLSELDTVGRLFDEVYNMLYCQENSCKEQDFFLPSRYVIEFDQTMGYPRFITETNEYYNVETRIENVNILKRSDK